MQPGQKGTINVDAARWVDYYAGVPLCFIGTLLKKILNLFSPPRDRAGKPKKILFIELSEMGSAILADPAMRKLQQRLGAELYFVIFEKNSPSLQLLDTIPKTNIFLMRNSGMVAVIRDAFRFLFWTRENRIDTVVDLELFSRFTALMTGFSGAARTAGFHAFYNEGLYRGNFLTHKVAYNHHQHIAKNFLALANALLSEKAELPYSKTVIGDEEMTLRKVAVSAGERQEMLQKVKADVPAFDPAGHRIVLFNTDASDLIPFRRWPQENFVALAKKILEANPSVVILLTGDSSERPRKDVIVKAVNNGRCVNFSGRTTVRELPVLYSLSAGMLTNDSGPAQFASVTDMPVFVLFGPETPKLYGPLGNMTPIYAGLACSPCVSAANHRKTVCDDNICMKVISPDMVLRILQANLLSPVR